MKESISQSHPTPPAPLPRAVLIGAATLRSLSGKRVRIFLLLLDQFKPGKQQCCLFCSGHPLMMLSAATPSPTFSTSPMFRIPLGTAPDAKALAMKGE
ncbi:hypothetical protein SKAU_G00240870 [Synaphobranchus kaupii]|uniref:Uncharacterized protein n=1 Tax=Synaphobranchus kaupii TaxID=118154 RepID=A0A9Q1F7Z5_SYNKA|nr:hypothetical protein SKAU_G00240870 [Synaphobranchus kaupii]